MFKIKEKNQRLFLNNFWKSVQATALGPESVVQPMPSVEYCGRSEG